MTMGVDHGDDHGGDHGELTMGMMLTDQNKVVVKSDYHTK